MAEYGKRIDSDKENISFGKGSKNSQKEFFGLTLLPSNNLPSKKFKVPLNLKLIFFRQLSVILESGVTLSQGLELLAENIPNKQFGICIQKIATDLSTGLDLSLALKEYPRIFDQITTKAFAPATTFPSSIT